MTAIPSEKKPRTRRSFWPTPSQIRENLTGYLFISPAMLIIALFGLFPIGYAVYMSFYRWRVKKVNYRGLNNYLDILGDWDGALLFAAGFLILIFAYWIWVESFSSSKVERTRKQEVYAAVLVAGGILTFWRGLANGADVASILSTLGWVAIPLVISTAWVMLLRRLDVEDGLSNFVSAFFILAVLGLGLVSIAYSSDQKLQAFLSALVGMAILAGWTLFRYWWRQFRVRWVKRRDTIIANLFSGVVTIAGLGLGILVVLNSYQGQLEGTAVENIDGTILVFVGVVLLLSAGALWTQFLSPKRGDDVLVLKFVPAYVLLGVSLLAIMAGYNWMLHGAAKEEFLEGLVFTFYYAFGSVPIQLGLALVLAYILYQNIKGKETFRMIFFLPYVTPVVASALIFRTVFDRPPNSLVNQITGVLGFDPHEWLYESKPFINVMFGLDLSGFIAGPSMALVSIILLGIWTYTGYNTVIFLAGLGSIPSDLYEAAKVDGASQRHLFRHITFPLLSPITFYLSILAFIGTFKAFNHIYVMRLPQARGTADTASLVVFDTFRVDREYGLATAQAIILFFIILSLTQAQRNIFEKRVFYG